MDEFTTQVVTGVVRRLSRPEAFLLDKFFPLMQQSEAEKITFDVESDVRRVSPFVSPVVAGRVVQNRGYTAHTFSPAYVKDKRIFRPSDSLRRAQGEGIGGTMSAATRLNLQLRMALEDQLEMLTMREEIMAAEALRLGQVTVAGDGYDTTVVSFGRDASLNVALAGGALWSATGTATPVDDLEAWQDLIQAASGSVATDVVMDPVAWRWARQNAALRELMETRRGSASSGELGPVGGRVARFIGNLADLSIWVYQQTYVDENGATQQVLPDGTVLLGSADIEGTRAYGAIYDVEAGITAQRVFTKTWVEKDPSHRILLMQSAPLVVPYRPNASLRATVI